MAFSVLRQAPTGRRTQVRWMLIAVVASALFLVGFFMLSKTQDAQSSIPIPFVTVDSSALKGALADIGAKAGKRLVNVTFNAGEISEQLPVDALSSIFTSNAADILDGAPLSVALTRGKRLYGYKYFSGIATRERHARAEADSGIPKTFSELFPGQFFASAEKRSDGTFITDFENTNHVTFLPLDQVTLERGARYVVVAEDRETMLAVRDLAWCGNHAVDFGENCSTCPSDALCLGNQTCQNGECVDRTTAQCSDGKDNDDNGYTDYQDDTGCTSAEDDDESGGQAIAAQCSDGVDNDRDGITDGPGIRIRGAVGTFKSNDAVHTQTQASLLVNGTFLQLQPANVPWASSLSIADGSFALPRTQLFTPGSFRNEQIYENDVHGTLKAVEAFDQLTASTQAELCDPSEIEEFHLVGVQQPLDDNLHIRVATGKCTGIVVFGAGRDSAYAHTEVLIETLPGSRIARVAVFYPTYTVYGIPGDRIMPIDPERQLLCRWISGRGISAYTCGDTSAFVNYPGLAAKIRESFNVPSTMAPASNYNASFGYNGCTTGIAVPDIENGTGIRGVVVGSTDPSLKLPYWTVLQPEFWSKTSQIVMSGGTVFASFGSWPFIKADLHQSLSDCVGTERITGVPFAHLVRIDTGTNPAVRDVRLENIQYLSDLVWDRDVDVLYGIAATPQQLLSNAAGEYRLVVIDPRTLSIVRSIALPQLGEFFDFKQHQVGTSNDDAGYNYMPVKVSNGPRGAGRAYKEYRQLYLDAADRTLVVAGFPQQGSQGMYRGAPAAPRKILRINLDTMAVAEATVNDFSYLSLNDLQYDAARDVVYVSYTWINIGATEYIFGNGISAIDSRTGNVLVSYPSDPDPHYYANQLSILRIFDDGTLLVRRSAHWSILDPANLHEINGADFARGISMPDPAADVAFFIDGEGASGQFMFFSVDLRTLERTPIFGPAASMPSIMKDATKDEYYTYGQPFQRELYGPWYEDWKKLLLCNP